MNSGDRLWAEGAGSELGHCGFLGVEEASRLWASESEEEGWAVCANSLIPCSLSYQTLKHPVWSDLSIFLQSQSFLPSPVKDHQASSRPWLRALPPHLWEWRF